MKFYKIQNEFNQLTPREVAMFFSFLMDDYRITKLSHIRIYNESVSFEAKMKHFHCELHGASHPDEFYAVDFHFSFEDFSAINFSISPLK